MSEASNCIQKTELGKSVFTAIEEAARAGKFQVDVEFSEDEPYRDLVEMGRRFGYKVSHWFVGSVCTIRFYWSGV